MATFRNHKTKDFTVMSNYHLKDKNLSLKAKGLLSQMLSLPSDWEYSVNGLIAINKEEETAIKSALKELKDNGYILLTKKMPNETKSGKIEYIYDIYERPKNQKQEGDFLPLEIQPLENQVQYNTNNKTTKDKKEKYKKEKKEENEICDGEFFENKELNDLFLDFLKVRKKLKATNSQRAINILINKLNNYDDDTKYKMIEKSLVNSWKDVFEINPQKNNNQTNNDDGWHYELVNGFNKLVRNK